MILRRGDSGSDGDLRTSEASAEENMPVPLNLDS